MVRRYVATVLGDAGYRVLVADDGARGARDRARTSTSTCLLTDVVMPKISGPELAEHLGLPSSSCRATPAT